MKTSCVFLLLWVLSFNKLTAQTAQYATAGTGNMRNYISWFDWANVSVSNNTSVTFTTADGLTVIATFTNVTGPAITPYVMNTWSGAVLWKLYDFTDPSVKPALFSQTTLSQVGFTINFTATRAGVPTPFTLVAADAEGSDMTESTTFTTNGAAWKTIEFFRNSTQTGNPLAGCGTQTAILTDTYGGAPSTGQNPILTTDANGSLTVSTTMNRTTQGGMAVAFGIFAPIDRGDLPASYTNAQHGLNFTVNNSCNFNSPFPSILQNTSLRLGTIAGDADGAQTLNDNSNGADEDAASFFPSYNGSGSYSLSVSLANTTGSPGNLMGWFDYNRDGSFSASEAVSVVVPNGANTASLTWAGLPATLSPGAVSGYGFRLRLASNATEITNPGGYAANGEVEDYLITQNTITPPIVTAAFAAPDTVCVGASIAVTNTSSGASNYYWNFCTANVNTPPIGTNMGNIGGTFNGPVFIDYAFDNGNYYGFQTNNYSGNLIRLDFGNSLLNTPVATNLGSVGGTVPRYTEGVQVIKNEGKWYVFVVGDQTSTGLTSAITKIELGTNIANNSPVGTNWGNIGNISYPHDLYMFDDNGHWYGFTVNAINNTVTRFDFTTSFSNTPTGVNFGNIGNLNYPTGVCAFKDNTDWYAFVTNANGNTLTRLNFGTSLLNTPTAVNLGNPGNIFSKPWDIQIMKYCGEYVGFLINAGSNTLAKLDFGGNITNTPSVQDYGNIGSLNFPHCLSRIFRVGADLYTFISNVSNNSLTRLKFSGCTNASIPNSSLQDPPPIIYNSPGVYNINLTVDDGLPTQSAFCKQLVVLGPPGFTPLKDTVICPGSSVTLNSGIAGTNNISWSPAAGLSNTTTPNPVATPNVTTRYIVTATNAGGCSIKDTVVITVRIPQQCLSVTPGFTIPDTICVNTAVNIVNTSTAASSYYWNFCSPDLNASPTGSNLGNPGNSLTTPCFMEYASENGNYYGFITSNNPASLVRLDFGNSLLNTPTATNLGNFGGVLPRGAQGIQLVNENGRWYAIIAGGDPTVGEPSKIMKLDFGASLTNNTPVMTDWGNIGGLDYPVDLYLFKESTDWYGITVNYQNSTITRFNFGADFSASPTGVNLGNLGNLNKPNGFFAVNDNGVWRLFVANFGGNTMSRIDFGNSLLNAPAASVNLGNPGGMLHAPRDLTIFNYCGQSIGFLVNETTKDIVRLNFSSLTSIPTATSLGNVGGFDSPHSISKIFRVGSDLYGFVANSYANTFSRIKFSGCTNSSIPNSTLQAPPSVSYNAPGTYSINLTVDDGLPTQATFCKQIVVIELKHSATKNYSICSGGSVKIGSSFKSATYLWNTGATSDSVMVNTPGTYWVESGKSGCSVRDSFIVTTIPSAVDFGFQQNLCSPKTVQFTTSLTGIQSFQWDFDNGQTNATSQTPLVTFTNYGTYNVRLQTILANGCRDSVVKSILLENPFDINLITNSDTTICLGDSLLLKTSAQLLNYCLQSSDGTGPSTPNTYVKPASTIVYTLTAQLAGNNLVTNGDFSAGNTGFTSAYNHAFPNTTEGQYWIGAAPSSWNGALSNCKDHTTGTGQMMAVNGSPVVNAKVWSQTITVTPNTNYNFSVWIQSLSAPNPANLQFSINGINLGNSINASSTVCQWKQFSSTWNSGSNTSALINVVNNNTIASGNDFALDDIFFGTITTKTDSLTVNVTGLCDSIRLTGINKVCSAGDTMTYSIYKSPACTQQYVLQVDNSFATIVSQTPTSLKLLFKKNGTTSVKVAYANNCKTVVDSLNVDIKFSPTRIQFAPDIVTCRDTSIMLHAGSDFGAYIWQDGSTDSTYFANTSGIYSVDAQNICGAHFTDTFQLQKTSPVPFAVSPSAATICKTDSVRFTASGGTSYSWQPAGNFNSPLAPSSNAFINATQVFTVSITDAICGRDTVMTIPVTSLPGAVISLTKSNDVNCGNDSSVLVATGGVSYTWSPSFYITRSGNGQITVKPPQTQTYYVTGKDAAGCTGKDSITVSFSKVGDQKLFMPSGFTPNGDGLNEVFRPAFIGPAMKYDFRIYNRWGQLVFRTNTPGMGWDGVYKSTPQPKDVYVYYITAEGGCNGKFEQKGTFVLIR